MTRAEVERYEPSLDGNMEIDPSGAYVDYDDYMALLEAKEAAEKQLTTRCEEAASLQHCNIVLNEDSAALRAEVARLQRAIERKDAALQTLAGWMYDPDDIVGCYERINEMFMRNTGYMRPGKDAVYEDTGSVENHKRFNDWCGQQQRKHLAIVRAALTGTAPLAGGSDE